MDGQARCASQNFGDRTSGSAADRTPFDVGRGAKCSSSLGGRDRHSEHRRVLRHRAQNGVIADVTLLFVPPVPVEDVHIDNMCGGRG